MLRVGGLFCWVLLSRALLPGLDGDRLLLVERRGRCDRAAPGDRRRSDRSRVALGLVVSSGLFQLLWELTSATARLS